MVEGLELDLRIGHHSSRSDKQSLTVADGSFNQFEPTIAEVTEEVNDGCQYRGPEGPLDTFYMWVFVQYLGEIWKGPPEGLFNHPTYLRNQQ